jgi:hypothetical protein
MPDVDRAAEFDLSQRQRERHGGKRDQHQDPKCIPVRQKGRLDLHLLPARRTPREGAAMKPIDDLESSESFDEEWDADREAWDAEQERRFAACARKIVSCFEDVEASLGQYGGPGAALEFFEGFMKWRKSKRRRGPKYSIDELLRRYDAMPEPRSPKHLGEALFAEGAHFGQSAEAITKQIDRAVRARREMLKVVAAHFAKFI